MSDAKMDFHLMEAVERVGRRKGVICDAIDGDHSNVISVPIPRDNMTMFAGMDVDPEQVLFVAERMARAVLAAMLLEEIELPSALLGQWVDGFLVGLELARVRAEDESYAP